MQGLEIWLRKHALSLLGYLALSFSFLVYRVVTMLLYRLAGVMGRPRVLCRAVSVRPGCHTDAGLVCHQTLTASTLLGLLVSYHSYSRVLV